MVNDLTASDVETTAPTNDKQVNCVLLFCCRYFYCHLQCSPYLQIISAAVFLGLAVSFIQSAVSCFLLVDTLNPNTEPQSPA